MDFIYTIYLYTSNEKVQMVTRSKSQGHLPRKITGHAHKEAIQNGNRGRCSFKGVRKGTSEK